MNYLYLLATLLFVFGIKHFSLVKIINTVSGYMLYNLSEMT